MLPFDYDYLYIQSMAIYMHQSDLSGFETIPFPPQEMSNLNEPKQLQPLLVLSSVRLSLHADIFVAMDAVWASAGCWLHFVILYLLQDEEYTHTSIFLFLWKLNGASEGLNKHWISVSDSPLNNHTDTVWASEHRSFCFTAVPRSSPSLPVTSQLEPFPSNFLLTSSFNKQLSKEEAQPETQRLSPLSLICLMS